MTRIAVVSVARSDFSILRPVLKRLAQDPDFELELIAAGTHLSPEFGLTVNEIASQGFEVAHRVEMLLSSDTPAGTAKSMGVGILGFADLFASRAPDVLLLMGDRFEMFAAAAAAVPLRIPVAHIHGGELSEGAIDDVFRHAITKMSHLHFVATEPYRQRVVQLGEAPDRVIVSGAPALDNLRELQLPTRDQLEQRFGLDLSAPPLLVTFHPTTLEPERTGPDLEALLSALSSIAKPLIFTASNADPAGRLITTRIKSFVETRQRARFCANLGVEGYYGLLAQAAAMVGNSSSGIIEAASFSLPVVNVGNRQRGRIAGENVVHAPADHKAIVDAMARALSPEFRFALHGRPNPYGDGQAASRIVEALRTTRWSPQFCTKRFHDLPAAA